MLKQTRQGAGEVKILSRGQIDVDIDTFNISDYCMNSRRLEKYASLYNVVPMGADDGIWFIKVMKLSVE